MSKFKGFNQVKLTKPQRSTFDLSHDKRMSVKAGDLVPCLVTEAVPSDSFRGSTELLVRLAPLLAPIYDQLNVFVHFFFVPCRLLWYDWEEFITGGRLGVGIDPAVAPIPPQIDIGVLLADDISWLSKGGLSDYLGVPILPTFGEVAGDYDGINLDLMPFAAYQLIWSEYYRDRNFVDDIPIAGIGEIPMNSGIYGAADGSAYFENRVRCFSHDYFTSALPFTQRGEEVLLPVDMAVTYLDEAILFDSATAVDPPGVMSGIPNGGADGRSNISVPGFGPLGIENLESVSNASSTINDFRTAYALQVWLERNAVGGSRYTESTQAHFGVRPQDSRLQRPEYIGGGRIPVKISEVLSTSFSTNSDDDVVPLANMGGHGVTYGNTNHFSYFCTEHGFIMGILSIMSPPSYHQGLPRMFRRRSFLDYPWPTFAKLGEQQVDKAELYANAVTLTEDGDGQLPLFGYQSRYADWKYICNWNHGDFHDTLLFWTLTRDFSAPPDLDTNFLFYNSSQTDRIFAVPSPTPTSVGNFWIYLHNKVTVKRPLPYFGTPNTLGFV